MEIVRERFLDESRAHHLTIALRSRTTEMHSLLTGLTPDERAQVGDALVRALNDIEPVLRARLTAAAAR
jgi:hypothetical protein